MSWLHTEWRPSNWKIEAGDESAKTTQLIQHLKCRVRFARDTTSIRVIEGEISWTYERAFNRFVFDPKQDPILTIEQLVIAHSHRVQRRRSYPRPQGELIEISAKDIFPSKFFMGQRVSTDPWKIWRHSDSPFVYFTTETWEDRLRGKRTVRGVILPQDDLACALIAQRDWERERF